MNTKINEVALVTLATTVFSLIISYAIQKFIELTFTGHTQIYEIPFWRLYAMTATVMMFIIYIRPIARWIVHRSEEYQKEADKDNARGRKGMPPPEDE